MPGDSRRSTGEALYRGSSRRAAGVGPRRCAARGSRAGVRSRRTRVSRALLAAAVAAVAAGCASHLAGPAPVPAAAVAGRCGVDPGVCLLGVPVPLDADGEASGWRCLGLHGGGDAVCPLPEAAPPLADAEGVPARARPPRPPAASRAAGAEPPAPRRVAGAEPAVRTPAAAPPAPAAVSPRVRAEIAALLAAKARRTPAQRKLGSRLLDRAAGGGRAERLPRRRPPGDEASVVRAELDALGDREPAAALDLPLERVPAPVDTPPDQARDLPADTPLDPGRVLVDMRAEVAPALLARIRELGGAVVDSVPRHGAIRAELPLAALEPLAGMDAVLSIRTADEATTLGQAPGFPAAAGVDPPGSPAAGREDTSEGDAAHRTDEARRAFGVDGTGIGIGVLSNGVESLAERQASGDLPARVTVLPGQAGTGDEGTAMLEIVHDLAPGAELYFATAWEGQARFAENVEALCAAGADVIVDDVFYFREAAFQDGIVARGINAAVADGCFHFSAAGNSGNLNDGTSGTWEGDFVAGGELLVDGIETGGVVHDFGGGVTANTITKDTPHVFVLQWADPWGASANDYDLFLLDAAGESVLSSSTGVQDGTQDPVEMLLTFGRIDTNARLVIVKAPDAAERYLRLGTHGGELAIATAGETHGHLAAENGIGVAAVDVREAGGAGGVFHGTESVATDSSDGPRRIFFEPDGAPITPGDYSSSGGRVLQKPDLAAGSCVSTATPGFSPFCGTSAAAPHAAAVAALLLEAAGGPGEFTLPRLRAAMAEGALDIEAEGVDRDSGAGIVMAGTAVDAADVPPATRNRPPVVAAVLAGRTLEVGRAVTIDLTGAFADPDDDVLRYTAHSGDPGRLSAHAAGSTLTPDPAGAGRHRHRAGARGRSRRLPGGAELPGDGRGGRPRLRPRRRRADRGGVARAARRGPPRPERRRRGGRPVAGALARVLSRFPRRGLGHGLSGRVRRLRADGESRLRHQRQRGGRRRRRVLERRRRLGAARRGRDALHGGPRG